MLILMRRRNESILIGDDIEVVLVGIKSDEIVLAIRAPRIVKIMRGERAGLKGENNMDAPNVDADASENERSELRIKRKVEQSVLIGTDVEVVIFKIEGRQVSMGIKADRNIKVFRKECLERPEPSNYY